MATRWVQHNGERKLLIEHSDGSELRPDYTALPPVPGITLSDEAWAEIRAAAAASGEELEQLTEAKDSLAKASTPQPFSTSKTSNWVARVGGLPDYIQHVAHGILRSDPEGGVSGAIQKAIGVVKRWAAGGGKVDANTRAAAAKAVAEWEKKKAENKAKAGK